MQCGPAGWEAAGLACGFLGCGKTAVEAMTLVWPGRQQGLGRKWQQVVAWSRAEGLGAMGAGGWGPQGRGPAAWGKAGRGLRVWGTVGLGVRGQGWV